MKYVGQTQPIHDARAKVTGRVLYAGDLKPPRLAHAKLVLSDQAHARVAAVDARQARALPGVLAVFTAADVPARVYDTCRLIPDQEYCVEDEPLLTANPRFVGDRVAVVVAISPEVARRAAGLVRVEYEPLPVVAELAAIWADQGQDPAYAARLIDEHTFQTGWEGADTAPAVPGPFTEVTTTVSTPKTHHAALEAHVCLADCDGLGQLTIWTPCQGAYGVRTVVAELLGLPYHQVRVVKTTMGGSFGGKQEALLEPLTAFLAQRLERPVRLQLERLECMVSTMTRPATITRVTSRLGADGRLAACDLDSMLDAGGYVSSSAGYVRSLGAKLPRLYRVPRITNRGRAYWTNTPKAGGARGWGSPEFFAALEIHLDLLARAAGRDPVELRLANLVHPGDSDPLKGLSLGNTRVIDCVEKGAADFGWAVRRAQDPGRGRWRRGVGMACGAHTNGMVGGFPDHSTMTLRMNEDGTCILNTSVHDMGCGTLTSLAQIVGEVLDIAPGRVLALEADTQRAPYDFGTYGSRVTYICGACAQKVAERLRDTLLELAGRELDLAPAALEPRDGGIRPRDRQAGPGLDYRALALKALEKYQTDLIATLTHTGTSNPGSQAAHFAEVAVDTCTGLVKVTDYLAVQDVGRALNPGMIEGQVQGAVQMGIGYALLEQVPVDDRGRVKLEGFKDYHIINAPDMPAVRVAWVEEGGDDGPFGAKSVGEIAFVPVAPAVVNAVNHALGTSLCHLPLTPEKVLAAL